MSTSMKNIVEELLGAEITEEQFRTALESARKKQLLIFQREKKVYVLEMWYLMQLTREAVVEQAFSQFTVDLCMNLNNMKKEHLSPKDFGTQTANHIVSAS